jgi:hypothetical protein
MNANQLLDQKQNERFSQKQKEEILTKIEAGEEGRSTSFAAAYQDKNKKKESGELEAGGESLFNNVAAMNLQFFDKYIDKTVDWEAVKLHLTTLGKIGEKQTSDEDKAKIKKALLELAKVITLPASFKAHYLVLGSNFKVQYDDLPSASKDTYESYFETKGKVLGEVHKFKHDALHSSLFGDESKIDSALRSWSVYGDSNFVTFSKLYNELHSSIVDNAEKLKIGHIKTRYELVEMALKEMNVEHQKREELKRAKRTKPVSP